VEMLVVGTSEENRGIWCSIREGISRRFPLLIVNGS
jgi:hypothetical protein